MDKKQRKAKRKLSNIDFSSEGAHLALCSKEQGVANGADYALVIKSSNQFSDEFVEKMQTVRVTMELPDFLRKFFNMYYDDADVLARLMGYVPKDDFEEVSDSYEDYINSKLSSIEIMKSLHESEEISSVISKLSEDDFLNLIKDQERLEKVFKKIDKESSSQETESKESSTEVKSEVGANVEAEADLAKAEKPVTRVIKYNKGDDGGWKPTVNETQVEEENMTKKAEVEVVEKSVVDQMQADMEKAQVELQKALEAQKEELQKAKELVAQFEAERKEAIVKARFEQVKSAVKNEEKAEILFKAVGLVEKEEEFQAVVKALADLTALVEQSEMFVEKGVSAEGEGADKISAVAKLLKAKNSK